MSSTAPATTGVHHVALSVSDLEVSRAFFRDLLGFSIVSENPEYPMAILSDGQTKITLWQVENPQTCRTFDRRQNIGLHHLALGVKNKNALIDLHKRLLDTDTIFEFEPELTNSGQAMHMMTLIPGGPRVEFICAI